MFFENLKKITTEKGIVLAQLEKDIGLSRGAVYKWKQYLPSVTALCALSNYLGVSIDELLRGCDEWKKENSKSN